MSDKNEKKVEFNTVQEVLHHIQTKMKAPKNQENKFGGYRYRSCEDIQEAVKPFLPSGAALVLNDEIVLVGDRYYIKATASITFNGADVHTTAYARETLTRKGMDDAQVTGATSSYARKYALNGLLLIDDTKDADATNDGKEQIVSDAQAAEIKTALEEVGADVKAFLKHLKAETVDTMTLKQFEQGKILIEKKRKQIEGAGA